MSLAGASVSIIIPARNEAAHLPALLTSLAAVEYPRNQLEVIVVDHQSTDGTPAIAEQAGARVLRKSGGTISSVRNLGAASASGDILVFLDADCTVAKDWLRLAVLRFSDPTVGAVGSYHSVPLTRRSWVRRVLQKQIEGRPQVADVSWLPSGNMFVRRDVFTACKGFDETLVTCEDVDLSYRIAQSHRLVADAAIKCWHHGEPETLWQVFRKELWRGRDNLSGAIRHGISWSEIPSLLLPLYFVAMLAGVLLSGAYWLLSGPAVAGIVAGVGALGIVLPLLAVAGLMSIRGRCPEYFPHFAAYFAVYFLARGLGPLYAWRNI